VYLLERLQKIEDEHITEATWKDVLESWMALLDLRGQIDVERGQAVLECILADRAAISGLGAAHAMLESRGTVPTDLLTILNQGPGAHIRQHAFSYRKELDHDNIIKRTAQRSATTTLLKRPHPPRQRPVVALAAGAVRAVRPCARS
jgi:hypothetical protein